MFNIGVLGYGRQSFIEPDANHLLNSAFEKVLADFSATDICVVSGLSNRGIPPLAYNIARKRGWKTFGIGCSKVQQYECCEVDRRKIVGGSWREWLKPFLQECNVLVGVGGGVQTKAAIKQFRKDGIVYEYGLQSIALRLR